MKQWTSLVATDEGLLPEYEVVVTPGKPGRVWVEAIHRHEMPRHAALGGGTYTSTTALFVADVRADGWQQRLATRRAHKVIDSKRAIRRDIAERIGL